MLSRDGRLRVAVRPSFFPGASGVSGGIESYVQGLASGLSALDGEDRYEFVGTRLQHDALAPFLGGAASFVTIPDALRSSPLVVRFMATRPGKAAVALRQKARARSSASPRSSPDVVEQDAYSVVHYPAPSGELTNHPSIYQPWDLQHLHFPEFFRPEQLRGREVCRICSERATYVLVASTFVRDDVIAAYDVEPDRVAVVPPGVPSALHATPPDVGLGRRSVRALSGAALEAQEPPAHARSDRTAEGPRHRSSGRLSGSTEPAPARTSNAERTTSASIRSCASPDTSPIGSSRRSTNKRGASCSRRCSKDSAFRFSRPSPPDCQ